MSEVSDHIRKAFHESDTKRDKGLTTPENIVRYDDIRYAQQDEMQLLDVYRPKEMEGQKLPVIFSVHGGAWVYGDKNVYQFYCMQLAQQGFAVVNFTYRLAPEVKILEQIEDINQVVAWIFEHAKEYLLDTEHIFAVGDSAGAHLLSVYTAICTNPAYAKSFSIEVPHGFVPTAIALNCGIYQVYLKDKVDSQTALLMADLLPKQGTPEELEWISSINHVTKEYPPVFLMTATDDFLKMQVLCMQEALLENCVPYQMHLYGSATHPLGHVFQCHVRTEDAQECNRTECEFFRKFV